MSSFHRPSLTQEGLDLSDALQLLESFKRKKNTIAFRWNIDCIEAFDFTDFSLEANLGGDKFVFKTGFVLYQTDDLDDMVKKRDSLILENFVGSRSGLTPLVKRKLLFPTTLPTALPGVFVTASSEIVIPTGIQPTITPAVSATKRTLEEIEKENTELKVKVQKLEDQVSSLSQDNLLIEDQMDEWKEKFEKLKKEQPEALMEKMKEHLLDLQHALTATQAQSQMYTPSSNSSTPSSASGSPSSSVRSSPSPPTMVKIHAKIDVPESALRRAKVAFRTDGNSNRSRNNGVGILLDALYEPEELANFSLSGLPCPSQKGVAIAKPKFPDLVIQDITSLMIKYWDDTYKGAVLTEQQCREAVGAKLTSEHTKLKQRKQKAAKAAATSSANGSSGASAADTE